MKNTITTKNWILCFGILISLIALSNEAKAAARTFTSNGTGDWSTNSTWNGISGHRTPVAGDSVIIQSAHKITVSGSEDCQGINMISGTIIFTSGGALTVANNITTTSSTGTITLINNTSISANAYIQSAGTLTFTTASGVVPGTVVYSSPGNVANHNPVRSINIWPTTYNNLTIDAVSFIKTVASATTVNGTLTITSGTLAAGSNLNIKGNFDNNSAFTGNATFNGTSGQTIQSANSAFALLSITNTVGVTMSDDVTVTGNLSGGGKLSAGTHILTVGGNFAISTFTAGTSTVILNGSSQTIGAYPYYNLTMNSNVATGTATLTGDIAVTNQLTMTKGNINSAGFELTLGTSANSLGTLSMGATPGAFTGSGTFTRWFSTGTVTLGSAGGQFPMGVGSNARNFWVGISNLAGFGGASGGTISVIHTDAAVPAGSYSPSYNDGSLNGINAYNKSPWTISYSGIRAGFFANPSISIRIEAEGLNGVSSYTGLTIGISSGNPGGTHVTGTGSNADPVVGRTGLDLSDLNNTFFIAGNSGANPLPVTLVSFNANYENNHVNLNWATASEINNHYFNIGRSTDGQQWETIGQVEGHGNSLTAQNYFAIDNLAGIVPAGDIYYRLEQVDFNGDHSYSMIRSVNINQTPATSVVTYPNPATGSLNLSWTNFDNDQAALKLINVVGQTVYTENVSGLGTMHKQIDISKFPAGNYFVQIVTSKNISSQPLIIR